MQFFKVLEFWSLTIQAQCFNLFLSTFNLFENGAINFVHFCKN